MTSEISIGFLDDCHVFLQRFIALNSINFSDFCNVWNDLNFYCIFYGRQSVDDLNTFVEEALIIVKKIFIRSSNLIEKCCCLYLLYTIYQKQPDKYVAKIRVTESDWVAFKNFYSELNSEEYQHPFIIWWKLLHDDSFHFCLFESKHLLDGGKSDKDKTEGLNTHLQFKPISASIINELENLQTDHGIMSALEAIEIAYNEMKEHLDEPNVSQGYADEEFERNLPPSALVKDIKDAFVDIQDLFTPTRPNRGKRKKPKKITEKSKEESDDDDDEGKGDNKQSIKDKRKSIKDRAFKEIKRKRGSVTDKNLDQPSCSTQESIDISKQKSKPIVDQIHFKKITEVQKIFEMNSLLKSESDSKNPIDVKPSPSPKKK